ncbi:hypothetical protein PHLGIDRAFT_122295 [Phlebiopsis gigantea 11061_1 CR5-6]|uniref:Uncharacterized protein n=1 Tax=Phlebiopsis gigantea (strain 11061_1 CR5-6) TaxID=745531 RepID=A0A0C3PC54_PHLG1|nr:hypothetical protein PHLGIDRAFT_122295 [Phlebiopsis gigantea 11061_1 CR5-6]
MPGSTDIICAFIASESVHIGAADKVITYKVALERFGRNSEIQFWKAVSDLEHLLELASKDTSLEPRLYYTRLATFDIPCEQCLANDVPCYQVSSEPGKRSSKKCIPCFNHSRPCTAGIQVNDGDNVNWSPPKRRLQQKFQSMEDRDDQAVSKNPLNRTSKHSSSTLPWIRSTDIASLHEQQAESSQMARRRTASQGAVGTLTATASTSQAISVPIAPANKSNALPRTPGQDERVAAICRPKMDTKHSQDSHKRVQYATLPVTISQPGDRPVPTVKPEALRSVPKNQGSISAPPKPSSVLSTLQQRRKSLPYNCAGDTASGLPVDALDGVKHEGISSASGSGSRIAWKTGAPAPQRQRFVTPMISFQGLERGYMGVPTKLEPVVASVQRSSERPSLRSTHSRPPADEAVEENSSPRGTKRISETADDDNRKKRKVVVDALHTAKAVKRTPRRKSGCGPSSREAVPTSPIGRLTPPRSRTASPAPAIVPHLLPTPTPIASNLIAAIDAIRTANAQTDIPRPPTPPVSPSRRNENLPDSIWADLLAAEDVKPQLSAALSAPSSALSAPSLRAWPREPSHSSPFPPHEPMSIVALSNLPLHTPVMHDSAPSPPLHRRTGFPPSSASHVQPLLSVPDPTVQQHTFKTEPSEIPVPSASENGISAFPAAQPLVHRNPIPPTAPTAITPLASSAVLPVQRSASPIHVPRPMIPASPAASTLPRAPAPASQYAQFVELVYQKAKEIVEYRGEAETAHLGLKFAISDMRLRLEKIDKLQGKESGASSGKPLAVLKKLLLAAGKKVVSQMLGAQGAGRMDDVVLETMIEELEERLDEMKKLAS